jgi:hypothetical protein
MRDGFVKANRIESGNFPKSSFNGMLKDAYFTEKDNGMIVLKLDFEDGKTYDMQAIVQSAKAKTEDGIFGVHEDGSYDEFMNSGQWIKSVEALDAATGLPATDEKATHIQVGFAFKDGVPVGIDFEPDIRGHIIHNIASFKKTVGDETQTQTSKYPDWTIGAVEGLTAPKAPAKKGGYPKSKTAPEEKAAPVNEELTNLILETIAEKPMGAGEMFVHFQKKYKVEELRKAIAALGDAVTKQGDKYTVA